MAVTSLSVANQAISLIGNNIPQVTGSAPNFDGSVAGIALQTLYPNCVRTVAKEHAWDFAREVAALTTSGNAAPMGWAFEYLYPGSVVEILQLLDPSNTDLNNPLPSNWMVGNAIVSATQTKVIWTNVASATAVMNNAPVEATWDAGFQEAVVRLLASELAQALFGRPDTAQSYLDSGGAFESLAESRGG